MALVQSFCLTELDAISNDNEGRKERPPIETRLLRCLRLWRTVPNAVVEDGCTLFEEICDLLEFYICDCIRYGPKSLGGWWSDGVIHLEISEPQTDRFKLVGVTWIGSNGFAPFEIDVDLDPHDDTYFSKTIFRIGILDNSGHPLVCNPNLTPTRVLELRPGYNRAADKNRAPDKNREWAMAVELTSPNETATGI